jgi:hypothetical protein
MTIASGRPVYAARNDPSFCGANATVTLSALSSGGNTLFGLDLAVFIALC